MPISIFIEKLSGVNQNCAIELNPVEQRQEFLLLFFPLCFVLCFALSITKCSSALYHEPRVWKMLTEVIYCIRAHKQAVICRWHVNKSLFFPSYSC